MTTKPSIRALQATIDDLRTKARNSETAVAQLEHELNELRPEFAKAKKTLGAVRFMKSRWGDKFRESFNRRQRLRGALLACTPKPDLSLHEQIETVRMETINQCSAELLIALEENVI